MAPKPLYNWLDWWNTRRSSWGSIRGKARAQTSWGNARGGAPAGASKIAGANGTLIDTAALVVNASGSNASPQQYISPQQYVVINDANPLLTAEAQSLWDQALASASGYLANLLSNSDRDQLLQEVFGKAGTDAATFAANLQALLNNLSSTGLRIEVDLRSDAELNGALAAYAAVGHTGSERIYVNGDKLNNGELDLTLTISALLEEFGHAIDRRLNGGVDSPRDEGQLFAAQVTGVVLTAEQRALIDAEDDSAVLTIEGVQVGVEQAVTSRALTSATDNVGIFTGTLSSNSSTDDQTITFAGTYSADNGTSNNTIYLWGVTGTTYRSFGSVNVTRNRTSTWSITSSTISPGAYTFFVNTSSATPSTTPGSGTIALTVDTAAPATTAAVTGLTDNVGIFTGTLASASTTDDTSLVVTGSLGGATAGASLASGETIRVYDGSTYLGTATVTVVASGQSTWSYTDSRTLSNGTSYSYTARVADAAGNQSTAGTAYTVTVDTTAPIVSSVAITSATGAQNSTLNVGDVVTATITMSETVFVTGTPQLTLNVDGTNRTANYSSGSGSATLFFSYTIQAGDTDTNGIAIAANSLALNSGTISDIAGNAATLTFSAVADNASYLVDTTAPTAPSISSIPEHASGGTINATEASDGTTVIVDLTGTGAVAGDTLTINWGGQSVSYTLVTADITGLSATVTVPAATISAQGNGTFDVTASITDAAGNSSSNSTAFSVSVQRAVTFTATTGTDNPSLSSDNDRVIVTATTQIVAADTFSGGNGIDTIQIGTAGAGVAVNLSSGNTNGIAGFLSFEAIEFVNTSTTSTVTFAAGQFADGEISLASTFTGSSSNQAVVINLAAGGSFDASGFSFSNWTSGTDTFTLTGSTGAETITGSSEADSISGLAGNDTLSAGAGNDTLNGGAGADNLSGGAGTDIFNYAAGNTALTIGGSGTSGTISGYDVITDFTPGTTASLSEKLGFTSIALATTTAGVTGVASTLQLNTAATVKSHAITNGIISFDDATPFTAAVSLTSLADVAAVAQYLRFTDIGNAGSTVAFKVSVSDVTHTFVWIQGGEGIGTTNVLIDLVNVSATSLSTTGLTNQLAVLEITAPTVSSVEITSATGALNSTLNAGDVVSATVTMSKTVNITGTPQLTLNIGGTNHTAKYSSGSGSDTLVFSYTIQAADTDADGIAIAANSLALNSGTINDLAGNAATLTFSAVADNASYLVDTSAPTLAITSSASALKAGEAATITFTFSDAPSAFTVEDITTAGGALSGLAVSADPNVYTAIFTPTSGSNAGSASITVASGAYTDAAGNSGGEGTTPTITFDTLAPSVSIGAQAAQLVEAGSTGVGTASASRTLTLSDGTYSTDYLIANGWTAVTPSPVTTADANGSGYSYEIKNGQVGSQSFTLTGSGSYLPTSLALALVRVGTASPSSYPVVVEIASQAQSGGTVYFSWSGFANTFPGGDKDNSSNRTSVELSRFNDAVLQTGQQYFIRVSSTGAGLLYWSGSSTGLTDQLSGNAYENLGSVTDKDLEYQLTYTTDPASYNKTGTYGAATLNTSTGALTYTLNNSDADTNALAANDSASESFTIRAVDTAGNATDTPVSFTITGANDAAVISGTSTGLVTEAGGVSNASPGTPVATGDLASIDVDNTADSWMAVTTATASASGYGTYMVTAAGVWTYSLNNNTSAVQALNTGQTLSDSFTVTTIDGTAQTVTITINGSSDAPTVTSGATASFAENATGTAYTATATDPEASTTLSYSIAGADAALFNINSTSGAVTFKSAPNFEAPADAGGNNVYDITVTASDGSLSSAARAVAITVTDVDDTPPNAPLITTVSDDVNPVTGVVANGGSTNDTVLLIAGTAEANSTIQLFNGATSIGSTTADGAGAWTFTTGTLANNTQYSFNATATDAAGNVSFASASYIVIVDTSPPASLILALGAGLDDGATAAEATAATGAVSVLAQAGTNVTVSFARSQGGSVTKNLIGSGAGQAVVLSTADLATLGDGVINVSAVASDGAGNSSDTATATFTLDTTAPQLLALTLQADTGSSSKDGITFNPQVLVSQLVSGSVWELSTNSGSSWTTGNGNSFSLAEGSYATNQVQVRQRDTAGNISTATGNSNAWLVDSTAPQFIAGSSAIATPILENSGSIRTIYTPQMAATEAATGGVLRYSLLSVGDASSFSVGTFSGAVTLLSNPDYEIKSSYAFTLRAKDVAGNTTDQMVSLQVLDLDEVAPNAPQIAVVGSDDQFNGAEASSSVVISGTAEAGSLVTVRWGNNPARTATATGGSWSVTYSPIEIPANGTSLISATAKDLAGNLSSTGSRSVLVDRIAPNRPLLNTVAGDNIINASEWASGIQLQGTAELGSSVTANLAGVIRSTTVDANGNWLLSYASAALPVDGLASLSVICTDPAGNVSTAATRLLQVDSQAPLTPTLQTVAGDNIINAAEAAAGIQLNGSAEAGSTVQALWGGIGVGVGSAVVSSAGLWAINVAGAALPANGSSTLQIASRDAAGNNSGSLSRAIELDRLAPSIPAINSVGNGDVVNAQVAESGVLVSGSAEAGSLVRVQWGDQIRSVNAGSDGTWEINYSSSQLPLNGQSTITATAIDALGNVSAAATRSVLIDTTPSTTLVTNLKLSADSGSSDSDFVTAEPVQLLSASLSAALQTGETVQVSLDGGSQWISAQAGSSPLNFSTPVNLGSGDTTGTIQVVVVDAAGNAGAVRSQAYRLEGVPNRNGITTLSIGADSGVVGDLLTNVSQQSLRGTLFSPLQAGERIQFRSLQSNGSSSGWGTASGSTNSIDFTFHSTFQEGENQLELRHLDIAGNASPTFSLAPQLDSAAPKVSSITVNGAGLDRAWQAGDVATIQVNFSESITVSGIPSLTITLANQSKACTYAGNSANQLQFTYTISANDLANGSPVIAIVPGSLVLSDVAISDAAGNIALAAINTQLIGSGSADLINGTSLNDVITGAAGSDQLSGGLGSDLFVFRSGRDSCLGSSTNGFDTITDFQLGSDQLQLGSLAPVSSFTPLGSLSELSSSALSSLLNPTTFQTPGVGVQFSFGDNTFLAVNDNNAGFSELEDLVVMIGNQNSSMS